MRPKGYKVPICEKCGRKVIGRIPEHVVFVCFFCKNPNPPPLDEENLDTNWKDKK
jgi:hypothetical protein